MIHAGGTATIICENTHFRVQATGSRRPRTTTSEVHRYKANATHARQRPAMMIDVSASMAMRGTHRSAARIASALLALIVLAAGGIAIWYRQTYNIWPGQGASARVHWCGRDYENFGGPPQTWRQISSQQRSAVHPVGQYPPLGWSRQELFAATGRQAQQAPTSPPPPCAMIVYLRTGPSAYQPYSLEGGP